MHHKSVSAETPVVVDHVKRRYPARELSRNLSCAYLQLCESSQFRVQAREAREPLQDLSPISELSLLMKDRLEPIYLCSALLSLHRYGNNKCYYFKPTRFRVTF